MKKDKFSKGLDKDDREVIPRPETYRVSENIPPVNMENKWIKLSERLPEPNVNVLVVVERTELLGGEVWTEMHTGHMNKTFWIVGGHFGFDMGTITHWMPLPELP